MEKRSFNWGINLSFIEKETATLNQTIATIEKEIALVEEYKTALIAEAVTGKIDLRDFVMPANFSRANCKNTNN